MDNVDPVYKVGHQLWRVVNRTFSSNSYICGTGESGDCFLVDPGTNPEAIQDVLDREGLTPSHVICTHGHFDHTGGAAHFQDKYGVVCLLHGADRKTLLGSNFLMMALKVPYKMKQPEVDEAEGLVQVLGDRELRVIPSPGHTPGSCFLQYGKALFTGDTLYSYGVGLSGVPGQNSGRLKATLLGLWDQIPGDALVLPGHGDCAPFSVIKVANTPLLDFLGLPRPSTTEK